MWYRRQLRNCIKQSLSSCHKVSAISLLCNLLDSQCQQPIQNFYSVHWYPTLHAITHPHHLRYVTDNVFCCCRVLLGSYNLLDVFINSFLGMIPIVWFIISLTLRERRGTVEGWSTVHSSFAETL